MSKSEIFIYHTNDIHSHFASWPHIAGYLKEKKQEHRVRNNPVFVFDIGDHADRSHPITEATNGKANVMLLNEVGYDGVTIGNNEGITFPKTHLNELYGEAAFSVIVANLQNEQGEIPPWAKKYEVYSTENGIKIGVIGLTAPFVPFYRKLGWEITDPYEVLPPLLNEVKQEADIIVLLSHLGWHHDQKLAEIFPEITVILGAHTHHLFENGQKINNTYVGQTGKFGHYVGTIKIVYNHEEKKVVSVDMKAVTSNQFLPSDETTALLNKLDDEQKERMGEVLAYLKHDLVLDWFSVSPAIEFAAKALKEWCNTEISMVNAGILLEGLNKGFITRGDILRICPHPINPCVVTVTGEQLADIIQIAFTDEMKHLKLKGLGFRGEVMGEMIFEGVNFEVSRLNSNIKIEGISVLGNPIENKKKYKVATLDMFTFGKLYPALAEVEKEYLMPELIRDILAWKLKNY